MIRYLALAAGFLGLALTPGLPIIGLWGNPLASPGQEPAGLKDDGKADKAALDYSKACLSSGCHAALKETPWVHGPVSIGACDACHAPAGNAAEHKFQPSRPKKDACSFCHREVKPKAFQHKPFAETDCLGCHDPHGGKNKTLLLEEGAKLCARCHEPSKEKSRHAPVAEGKCLDCHAGHQGESKNLLAMPEKDLCLHCHQEKAAQIAAAPHAHGPAAAECWRCHTSHGGAPEHLLKLPQGELCRSCHEDFYKQVAEARCIHGVIEKGAGCTSCHAPHASTHEALLRAPAGELCLGCHNQEIISDSGKKVHDIRKEFESTRHKHGPFATADCTACHLPHASAYDSLLSKSYTEGLYAKYSEAAYELCFSCHDPKAITEERTTLTGFRDGERNLHRVHVLQDKGRTCNICHTPHSSNAPRQIRDRVTFGSGGWSLPIGFMQTESGGSCTSGCHAVKSYDRRRPMTAGEETRKKTGS